MSYLGQAVTAAALTAALALALLLVATPPGSAAAAKRVKIGSDLRPAPTGTGFGCGPESSCAVEQFTIPGNPFSMKAPFNGTIRKWRLRKGPAGNDAPYDVKLRVVRTKPNGRTRFLRSSEPGTIGVPPGIYEFKTRLRIRKGDRIAMELPPIPNVADIGTDNPMAGLYQFFPAPADGTGAFPYPGIPGASLEKGTEYLWNATVKRHRKQRTRGR